MKNWLKPQVYTNIVLLILFAMRFPIADLASNLASLLGRSTDSYWIASLNTLQQWMSHLYNNWSFVLVGIVIIINLNDLKSLNIDEYFITIFLASSLTYWTYYRWPSGWLALLVLLAIFILYKKLGYRLLSVETVAGKILITIAVVVFLGLLIVWDSLNITNILSNAHLIIVRIPFLLVEEVIFRGMLWRLLANLNWSPLKITLFQALLFWLSHAYYMLVSPVLFWIIIPIASILLGILVWRSKSLTISFLAHVSFNFLSAYF